MAQPVIRGVQGVGAVDIRYRYNYHYNRPNPVYWALPAAGGRPSIVMPANGIAIAGFRLDGEFLRANPQIASSVVIPILGGGGVALTNNNRTGTLTLNCARVSTPNINPKSSQMQEGHDTGLASVSSNKNCSLGQMYRSKGIGPTSNEIVFSLIEIAQQQQALLKGDSAGASILIVMTLNNQQVSMQFDGCTVQSVEPLVLNGSDAATHQVVYNYLTWGVSYVKRSQSFGTITQSGGLI